MSAGRSAESELPSRRSAGDAVDRECRYGSSGGFTLIELLVVMVIFGILASTAVWGLRAYQRAQEESGTARTVVTTLRDVAERAQAEGRTYCVSFDTVNTWSVWQTSCQPGWASGTKQVITGQNTQGSSSISVAGFVAGIHGDTCPADSSTSAPAPNAAPYNHRCLYFYPRGTASAGSLTIVRSGSSKTYLVNVEGLTGRVYT